MEEGKTVNVRPISGSLWDRRIPYMTIIGGQIAIIENRGRILEFSREKISLQCGRMTVTILGSDLQMVHMNHEEISIRGNIRAMEVG